MRKLAQLPGMDTMPMGGEPPAGPPAPTFKIIYSPLDSLGKILADLDLKTFLQNNFGSDPKELAQKIWTMYGGSEDELSPGKPGRRKDKPTSENPDEQQENQEEEYNSTRDSRWERLPEGVSIEEITNPEAIERTLIGGFELLAKSFAKPATATSAEKLKKLADKADEDGNYRFADKVQILLTTHGSQLL